MGKPSPPSRPPRTAPKTLNAKRLESENQKLRQQNEELCRKNRELELISQSFISITSSLDLDHVLGTILESIRNMFGVVGSSIWLKDLKTGEIVCRQAAGLQRNVVKGWRLAPAEGIAGWVSSYGESVILPDTRKDMRHYRKVAEMMKVELRSIISVPMRVTGEVIGALQLVDKKVNRFNEGHAELLEALAGASAIAIENAQLYQQSNKEVEERKRAEKKLRKNEIALREKTTALEEVNTALNVILKNREEDRSKMEDVIVANVKDLVLPFLKKLGQSQLDESQATYLEIIESNISDIISPFLRKLPMKFFNLTPTEVQIANLLRKGKSTKEIARILDSSTKTIEAHRNRLRKKLGLTNQRIQLRDYLMTMV